MPTAVWYGAVIAESDDVSVVDGYTYFPEASVDMRYLQPSDHHSICAWKGTASYYDIVVEGMVNPAAAWYYPSPSALARSRVSGRIGFWHGVRIEGVDSGSQRGLLARVAHRLR